MVKNFKKLFFGKSEHNTAINHSIIGLQWRNLELVWENAHYNDSGIERIFRLFLIGVQFFYPGIYIREIFSRRGLTFKNLAIEFYVLAKLLFPVFVFAFDGAHHPFLLGLSIYFVSETITYISSLVFTSDLKYETKSANRTILLLFLNYIEISLQFSMLYAGFNMLSEGAKTAIDYIYFSLITSASVGFGDIYPISQAGKLLVCCHSFLLVVFVVLFFNYFSSKRLDHHR